MRRLNPATGEPFKQGDVREDGYVFRTYDLCRIKQNGEFVEEWRSPASFKKYAESAKERAKRWQQDNPERAKERKKRWTKANFEHVKEYKKRWIEENLERSKESCNRWKQKNLDKVNANSAKRRAAKLLRTPKWLTKDQLLEIESFYTKAKYLQTLTGIEYHVDHIVPLQGKLVSGLHVPWNLQVIPAVENLKKHNNYEPTTEDSAANVTV